MQLRLLYAKAAAVHQTRPLDLWSATRHVLLLRARPAGMLTHRHFPPQALQLVVVAVHAKALSLLYVDQLLEDVKQVISKPCNRDCGTVGVSELSLLYVDQFRRM
jgi:hypothetical protein